MVHKAVVLKEAVQALQVLYLQLLLVVVARVVVIPTHHRVAREAEPLWVALRTPSREPAAERVVLVMGLVLAREPAKA